MCLLSNNIYDYHNVSQGKITVANLDDGEEFGMTDVSSVTIKSVCEIYHSYTIREHIVLWNFIR